MAAHAVALGSKLRGRLPRWLGFGLANLAIVLALSLMSWYLLVDSLLSPLRLHPMQFNALVFWAMLFVVFSGFICEFAGFRSLQQPVRGLTFLAAASLFAVTVTSFLAEILGSVNLDFAAARPEGRGYLTGALFVLFGFVTWAMSVQNWKLWPSTSFRLAQPVSGLVQIGSLAVPAGVLYLVFGLPAVSAKATDSLMPLDTVIGWFYSVVVSITVTGQTMDNWPWRRIGGGKPILVATASSIGNVVLGTGLYFTMTGLLHTILGPQIVSEIGQSISQYPAQLGVCWVFWMILWATAFGNRPTALSTAANLVIRVALTFALGLGTFVFYYYFAADRFLHEPAVATGLHGDALGFIDLAVLWTFLYVIGFDSYGLRRPTLGSAANGQTQPDLCLSPVAQRKFIK